MITILLKDPEGESTTIRPAWESAGIKTRVVEWTDRLAVKELVRINEPLSHVGFDSNLLEMKGSTMRIGPRIEGEKKSCKFKGCPYTSSSL
jgi:hypothetical protein